MTRYPAKTDEKHAEIRDGLRELGWRVWDCSQFGSGFPDLLVKANNDEFVLLEIKSDKQHLTELEQMFFDIFIGARVYIVRSLEDAILRVNGND